MQNRESNEGCSTCIVTFSDWLWYFRLLWNRCTEFNETWQEARSQCPLPSLCSSGRLGKQDGRLGLWLAETFSTSPLKQLNERQRNDRKQDLNVLYQVCVFSASRKNKMAAPASDWLRHFDFFSEIAEQNSRNLTGIKISTFSTKFVFFWPNRKNKMAARPMICWDIFVRPILMLKWGIYLLLYSKKYIYITVTIFRLMEVYPKIWKVLITSCAMLMKRRAVYISVHVSIYGKMITDYSCSLITLEGHIFHFRNIITILPSESSIAASLCRE